MEEANKINGGYLCIFIITVGVRMTVTTTEAGFLNVIGTKVLRVFLLAINSHLYYGFYFELKWFETGL